MCCHNQYFFRCAFCNHSLVLGSFRLQYWHLLWYKLYHKYHFNNPLFPTRPLQPKYYVFSINGQFFSFLKICQPNFSYNGPILFWRDCQSIDIFWQWISLIQMSCQSFFISLWWSISCLSTVLMYFEINIIFIILKSILFIIVYWLFSAAGSFLFIILKKIFIYVCWLFHSTQSFNSYCYNLGRCRIIFYMIFFGGLVWST